MSTADDQALMNDATHTLGEGFFVIQGLDPGYYDLYMYSGALATSFVYGASSGGAWPGSHTVGITYGTKLMVPVTAGVPLRIPVGPGLNNTWNRGYLNGVQLVHHGSSLGTNYCQPNPNSTGQIATTVSYGSPFASNNLFIISATGLPEDTFGMFVTSQTQAFVPNAGGGAGNLCLGGSIGRGVGGMIYNSGSDGLITAVADLTQHPTPSGPVAVMAGDSWFIQLWFRDIVNGSHTSNYSDGHAMTWQ